MSDANAPKSSRIKNEDGKLRHCDGHDAVEAYRLKCMIVALKLWDKTGMQPTRGVKILKLAQHTTGLKTRNVEALVAKLTEMMNAQIDKCEVITVATNVNQ